MKIKEVIKRLKTIEKKLLLFQYCLNVNVKKIFDVNLNFHENNFKEENVLYIDGIGEKVMMSLDEYLNNN